MVGSEALIFFFWTGEPVTMGQASTDGMRESIISFVSINAILLGNASMMDKSRRSVAAVMDGSETRVMGVCIVFCRCCY